MIKKTIVGYLKLQIQMTEGTHSTTLHDNQKKKAVHMTLIFDWLFGFTLPFAQYSVGEGSCKEIPVLSYSDTAFEVASQSESKVSHTPTPHSLKWLINT